LEVWKYKATARAKELHGFLPAMLGPVSLDNIKDDQKVAILGFISSKQKNCNWSVSGDRMKDSLILRKNGELQEVRSLPPPWA
jgi:hypothetical protein